MLKEKYDNKIFAFTKLGCRKNLICIVPPNKDFLKADGQNACSHWKANNIDVPIEAFIKKINTILFYEYRFRHSEDYIMTLTLTE